MVLLLRGGRGRVLGDVCLAGVVKALAASVCVVEKRCKVFQKARKSGQRKVCRLTCGTGSGDHGRRDKAVTRISSDWFRVCVVEQHRALERRSSGDLGAWSLLSFARCIGGQRPAGGLAKGS